jgi:hypothetical protein
MAHAVAQGLTCTRGGDGEWLSSVKLRHIDI